MVQQVCVVGAGVMGLCAALNIQERVPGAQVTIIADKFFQDTTSDGAAGLFRSTYELIRGDNKQEIRQWTKDSWEFYSQLALSEEATAVGAALLSGYTFYDDKRDDPLYSEFVFNFRHATEQEMQTLGKGFRYGIFCTTVVIEPRWFMPWLMKRYRSNGGRVQTRTIGSLDELSGEYDVVVNCMGLASGKVLSDPKVYATRGLLVRAKAPWVKHFVMAGNNYFIPCRDNVAIGAVAQKNDLSTDYKKEDVDAIIQGAANILPSIKDCEVERVWVGFRPYRVPVRLEAERRPRPRHGSYTVVHNYGHGGNGVTLAWGCGVHVARLVLQALNTAKL